MLIRIPCLLLCCSLVCRPQTDISISSGRVSILNTPLSSANNTSGACTNDGIGDCTSALTNWLQTPAPGVLYLPAGTYKWTNSSSSATLITTFANRIICDSNSVIAMTNANNPFMKLVGTATSTPGPNTDSQNPIMIEGCHLVWPSAATVRNVVADFEISQFAKVTVRHFTKEHGPSASLWISNSFDVSVDDARIYGDAIDTNPHVGADGVHFANVQFARAANIFAYQTGDDCLAATNGQNYPKASYFTAANVTCEYSAANGIRVEGYTDVAVSNINISNTANDCLVLDSGVLSGPAAAQSFGPTIKAVVSGGMLKNCGTWGVAQWDSTNNVFRVPGAGACVELYGAATSQIQLSTIMGDHCSGDGIHADSNITELYLDGIAIYRAAANGLSFAGYDLDIGDLRCRFSGNACVAASNSGSLHFTSIRSVDDCQDNVNCNAGRGVQFLGPGVANGKNKISGGFVLIEDNGSQVMRESVRFTGLSTAGSPFMWTNLGWTCDAAPDVRGADDSLTGVLTGTWMNYGGKNCSTVGTFTNPGGAGSATAFTTGQTIALANPTVATAGSGYSAPAGTFVVELPAPNTGACYGNQGWLSVTLAGSAVSSVAWARLPTQCLTTASWTTNVRLQPYAGITATTYGTASVSVSNTNGIFGVSNTPVNRNLFETNNGASLTTGTVDNVQFNLFGSNFGGVTISSNDVNSFFVRVSSDDGVRNAAASTTLNIQDHLANCNALAASRTITLFANPYNGQEVTVTKTDSSANTCTVNGNGHNINGAATISTTTQYAAWTFRYDGLNGVWVVK